MALFLFFLLSVTSAAAALSDPVPDRSALLRFKSSLLSAPPGWSGPDHCLWPGVTCAAARDPRVVALNLSAGSSEPGPFRSDPTRQPSGNLTAALAALSGLRTLETVDLSGCALSGQLPSRFPPRLRVLNLAANLITGEIPESLFSSLPRLRALFLSLNRLGGNIPAKIGSFGQNLENLDLSGNLLVGGIPTSLGNCGQLKSLLLFSNLLDGNIPSELGSLKKLSVLDVSRNSLSGTVPPQLGNCSELSVLVLLNFFDLMPAGDSSVDNDEFNYFQGGLSEKITSLPKLRVLWAPRAMFEGEFPGNWGGCGSLEMVNLGHNLFTGGIPAALGRCENLRFLNLSSNNLTGWLSGELNVPCMDLFDVSGNKLSGSIPSFGNSQCNSYALPSDGLPSAYYRFFVYRTRKGVVWPSFVSGADYAVYHDFGRNEFEGALPALLVPGDRYGNQAVYAFLADGNRLSGPLTVNQFAKCNGLNGLIANFSNNLISGGLPADIGVMCRNLMVLDVAGNRVSGVIPESVGLLRSLVVIDLSMNRLQGQIPVGFGELKGLKYLSLASNNLSGQIPSSLNQLHSLEVLDLSSNYLTGDIPGELVRLRNLTILRLNDNKLSGELPSGLANVTSLSMFNVSFNNLSGPLPTNAGMLKCDSVLGNPLLQSCHVFSLSIPPAYVQGRSGDVQAYTGTPPGGSVTKSGSSGFSSIEIASITSASAIVSVLFALIFLYIYTRKCARRPAQTGRKEVKIFVDIGVPLTYECVVQATGNFMASNCIGSGGFGATYKAEVSPGVLVAIKRLSVGRIQGAQQFHAEIKTLGRWRHPNLVTLIGYHIGDSEMFLVYNYLPGGNLERFIQERSKRAINWSMLHKIALDIARALAYLHDHCVPRILHRDVKPSNILLDNDFNAYLSDFGLARLLGNSETHATTGVAGTFGYVAPEYAMTCRVSDKADVYSYGVVLLELLSDKKALDPSFSPYGNGFNIVAWACMLLKQGKARDFFTEGLWDAAPHDDLVETLHLAVKCTVESLTIRPTMKQVVRRLRELQPPS